MLSKILSSSVLGIDAYLVEVEVDLAFGMPYFSIVGLPDPAIKESRERVQTAIKNSGFECALKRVTINLAPANVKKEGSAFDLPIAVGILQASEIIQGKNLDDYLIIGELSLDGLIKPVKGALSMAVMALEKGIKGVVLPRTNAGEAAVVQGINIFPVDNLPQLVEFLNGNYSIPPYQMDIDSVFNNNTRYSVDFSEVKGQEHVKRALEVAAAGGHNAIMIGPPGSGKSMLAQRIPTILPDLTLSESIETTKIHSIMGYLNNQALLTTRPFRSPHHTISDAGLIGGGSIPMPGEVSLAHNGILFLDELPEFHRNVLEVMRQPLEDGKVTISRASISLTYPASFMLIAASNPCPCGYKNDPKKNCVCSPLQTKKYLSKLSGPLMDRIDIHIDVPALKYQELSSGNGGETSEIIRERIKKVRNIQLERYRKDKIYCNSQISPSLVRKHCKIDDESKKLLESAMTQLGFSGRAYSRILKVARTIADLAETPDIGAEHISEAIQYRNLDRSDLF